MIDLDQVVLRRAAEQVAQVRSVTGDGTGVCACGEPLRAPSFIGPKPVTCGAPACILSRKYARQRVARRSRKAARQRTIYRRTS